MVKVDVIKAIFDSYMLIKKHYKGVLIPLLVVLVLNTMWNFGGSSSYNMDESDFAFLEGDGGLLSNSMTGLGALVAGLGTLIIAGIVLLIIIAVAISILQEAVWYYIYDYFYSLLGKKKAKGNWKAKIKKFAIKALKLMFFYLGLFVILAGLFAILFLLSSISFALAVTGFALLVVASLVVMFLLLPLWVYYVMDNLALRKSISKSVWLVKSSPGAFIIFIIIFIIIWVGSAFASLLTCCFFPITMSIIAVFIQLLSGVTLMNIKLQIEKKTRVFP